MDPFWIDEANTYAIAQGPLEQIPARLSNDASPPLYYFLLHFWMNYFGTSEFALRGPQRGISCACVILYLFFR